MLIWDEHTVGDDQEGFGYGLVKEVGYGQANRLALFMAVEQLISCVS